MRAVAASLALGLLATAAIAQDPAIPSVNDLRPSTAPAFTVLGTAPTEVERPTTPASFGASFANQTDNLSTLPTDYAVEFTPYWWFGHPRLTWQDDVRRSVWQSLARTAAFSLGTADLSTGADPWTGVAVGLRTSILSGELSAASRVAMRLLEKELAALATGLADAPAVRAVADLQNELLLKLRPLEMADALTPAQTVERDRLLAELAAVEKRKDAALREAHAALARDLVGDLELVREGWLWEIAGGTVWAFPDDLFDRGRNRGWTGWTTFGYDVPGSGFALLAIARYLDNDLLASEGVLDVGGRVLWDHRSFKLSAEYVRRGESGDVPAQDRLAGLVEYYPIAQLGISVTVGKDFAPDGEEKLVTRLGVKLGGRSPVQR